MKMVSAAKLKKAQKAIENSLPYVSKLSSIVETFVSSMEGEQTLVLSEVREVKKVAIVVVSSNSSLCGAFNSNAVKAFNEMYKNYCSENKLNKKDIIVYPIGKKVTEALKNAGIKTEAVDIDIAHDINYSSVSAFVSKLMHDFIEKKIDKVEFIYNHFKSAGVQQIWTKTLLPFVAETNEDNVNTKKDNADYIVEPNKETVINELMPKVVILRLFSGLQDSVAAEHAARTTTMQIATDNADTLLQDLRLTYNKMRQSAITTEIITITGGAEAIKQ
jgi:F-type H+-transporting ATPase subunit gamma